MRIRKKQKKNKGKTMMNPSIKKIKENQVKLKKERNRNERRLKIQKGRKTAIEERIKKTKLQK